MSSKASNIYSRALSRCKKLVAHPLLMLPLAWLMLAAVSQAPAAARSRSSLIKRAVASNTSGTITGTVTADGRPAPDVMVTARLVGSPHTFSRSAPTTEDGRFAVSDLPYATYTISVYKRGYVYSDQSAAVAYYRPGDSVSIALSKGGVITGRVTDADGAPIVAIRVVAMTPPASPGKASKLVHNSGSSFTDDRGIYRIYGLEPGSYIVEASADLQYPGMNVAYRGLSATYHPSSTIDTAAPVEVQAGAVTDNVDIRFKGDQGHTISGQVIDSSGYTGNTLYTGASISLYKEDLWMPAGRGSAISPAFKFSIPGIPDGTYYISADRYSQEGAVGASEPVRIVVKGSDVTGVTLQMLPFGSISGQVALEPMQKPRAAGCSEARYGLSTEALIFAEEDSSHRDPHLPPYVRSTPAGAPDDKGQFEIGRLRPGQYHLDVRIPDDEWYVRFIQSPEPEKAAQKSHPNSGVAAGGAPAASKHETRVVGAAGTQAVSAAAAAPEQPRAVTQVNIHIGSTFSGLKVDLAQGAAKLEGRLVMPKKGQPVPEATMIYAVPAESDSAKDPFRFLEAEVASDGSFSIKNVPPGKYYLMAKVAPVDSRGNVEHISWKSKGRRELEQEAGKSGRQLDLKPCQKVTAYSLPFRLQN